MTIISQLYPFFNSISHKIPYCVCGKRQKVVFKPGKGCVICDGKKEELISGVACYCPEGSVHTVINDGTEDLTFFAVVPEHSK
jgi:oxalate decarboxylase/phosphoglucose isomerase-like protein (cupin superfamily)